MDVFVSKIKDFMFPFAFLRRMNKIETLHA